MIGDFRNLVSANRAVRLVRCSAWGYSGLYDGILSHNTIDV